MVNAELMSVPIYYARAHKTLKIARMIADMESSVNISHQHIVEALFYRTMDRLLRYLTKNSRWLTFSTRYYMVSSLIELDVLFVTI